MTGSGLGQKYDLPLSGMVHGNNPSRAWKQERYGQDWLIGDTINASIGQGFTLTSPIQLATMTARLASGTAVLPRLVRPLGGASPGEPAPVSLGLSAEALAIVRQGMFEVSNHRAWHRIRVTDRGCDQSHGREDRTSQVFDHGGRARCRCPVAANSLEQAGPCAVRGLRPLDAPRYAVTVVVEHGGGGSTAAAPIARDIMLFAQHGGLPPEDAYPTAQRARIREDLAQLSERILPPDGVTPITVSRT